MSEPTIQTAADLEAVLRRVSFVNTALDFKWAFEYQPLDSNYSNANRAGWLLWVTFERPDTWTGIINRGRGRDEILWQGATLSGVVKTCWLLVELLVRHELMEGFRFDDSRIFNPHNSVEALARLQTAQQVEADPFLPREQP